MATDEGISQGLEGEAQDTGDSDGLASGFLAKIPEGDREIVGKYVKQWDSGVTRRFQELHGKYKPYEELGDLETLQQAHQLYQILDEEPERLYAALRETFGESEPEGATTEAGEDSGLDEQFQGVVTELQERLEKQNEVLEAIAEYVIDQHKSVQATQEDKELDEYLGLLKDEYGDFDEEYVLTKMYHGASGDEAVSAWQDMVQQHINAAGQTTEGLPSILSSQGGSAVARESQQRLGSVPNKDIKNLVADVISQANKESM
jgi:hypothetical protein